jgi:glycosyltransferase involved in cell wall biosynthesis
MKLTIVSGFFLPIPPRRGGAMEKIWFRLGQEFAAAGHQVTHLSRTWPDLPDRGAIAGVEHRRVPGFDHTGDLKQNLIRDFFWGLRVGWALPRADAVLCNTISLPVWLPWLRPSAGIVTVVLGRAPKGQLRWYGRIRRLYALSGALAAQARAEYPPIAARTFVMWCPIDWSLHAAAARQTGAPVVIGYIGRIHPEKGIGLLLQAAVRLAERRDLPAWRLELVGPIQVDSGGGGPEFLAELRAKHGGGLGDRLSFSGPEFDPAKLAERYGSMDVFCYPSIAEQGETFGVAVAEAMAAGCAPVVSALACFADFVTDGKSGLIFDHRSPAAVEQLAAILAGLVAQPARRRQIAATAQASVRRFDYPLVAQKLLDDLAAATRLPST